MLIDTHCHLDFTTLSARLPEILASASNCGIERFIVPGVEPLSWAKIISLAAADSRIFAALGVHPMHANIWSDAAGEHLEKLAADIVAIGEIGLDYSEGMPSRELQQVVFRAQLKIARTNALPVIIHCRKAFADILRILKEERCEEYSGVMHAFSGSVETASKCIALGLKIGIAGPLTWNNAVRPVQIVRDIPLRNLLLETDAPDLSPEAHRGEINEPAFLIEIARKVAAIKSMSVEDVAGVTAENARTVFHIMP